PAEVAPVRAELEALLTDNSHTSKAPPVAPAAPPKTGRYRITFVPAADVFRSGMDPLLVLRELADLGTVSDVELDSSRLPAFDALDPESCYLGWRLTLTTDRAESAVREVFAFVEDGATIAVEPLTAVETEAPPADAGRQDRRVGDRRQGD